MTGKADYSDEEWELLLEAPTGAGMIVIMADRGGSIRETFSMAKMYTEARENHGDSPLLDELVAAKPEIDKTKAGSQEEIKERHLQQIRDAVALVEQKGTPEELQEYKQFIRTLADRVANARKEGFLGIGGERVSEDERTAIGEIAAAAV
ncbi:MAG: hypothetical protein EXQ70_07320 [Solirubrobacterales bacterium]|nr:hypothetical protein [Solirubrobacterales bacterium]